MRYKINFKASHVFFLLVITFLFFIVGSKDNKIEASVNNSFEQETLILDRQEIRRKIEQRKKDEFLFNFDLELDFWLSTIPNKELVYYVMDNNLGIPRTVIFALVKNESSFIPTAIGRNSTSLDYGLFQLNTITYSHLDPSDLMVVENNVKLGIYHLYSELQNFNWSIELAVKAYNAGPSRVRNGRVPQSTMAYWNKINNDINNYSKMLADYFEKIY